MLISKRRFRWGFVAALLLSTALFVRPVRTWFDQALLMQIDPDLQVSAMRVHPRKKTVELDSLRWSKCADGYAFGLKTPKAWIAFDPERLLNREFVSPAGIFENTVLFLTASDKSPSVSVPEMSWKVPEQQIDWAQLQRQFSGLLAPAEVNRAVQLQINDWIDRSRHIQEQVQRIVMHQNDDNNPLRQEEIIRFKLERIEELMQEHQGILAEFASTRQEIQALCEDLALQLGQQSRSACRGALEALESELKNENVASQLMIAAAQLRWQQVRDFAHVANRVARQIPVQTYGQFEEDLWPSPEKNRDFIQFKNLVVSGHFAHGDERDPFQLKAEWNSPKSARPCPQSLWYYTFGMTQKDVGIRVTTEGKTARAGIELVLVESLDSDSSASDKGDGPEAVLPDAASLLERNDFLTRIVAHSAGDEVQAEVDLSIQSLGGEYAWTRVFDQALASSSEEILNYRVALSGTWEHPKIELLDAIPDWFAKAAESEVRSFVIAGNSHADAVARNAFQEEAGELQQTIDKAMDSARSIVRRHGQGVTIAHSDLRQRLDDITGKSFTAYRSGDPEVRLPR